MNLSSRLRAALTSMIGSWSTGIVAISGETRIDDLEQWSINNWLRLSERTRRNCVDYLRAMLASDDRGRAILAEWANEKFSGCKIGNGDPWFHHGIGMWVRNTLRNVLEDHYLPAVKYPEGEMRNWDDFYYGALDQLAAEVIAEREGK